MLKDSNSGQTIKMCHFIRVCPVCFDKDNLLGAEVHLNLAVFTSDPMIGSLFQTRLKTSVYTRPK